MRRLATGVVIVAAHDELGPAGLAVNSFTSVSLDPPLVLFCASRTSRSWPRVHRAGRFGASLLGRNAEAVSRVFSSSSDDKFQQVDWRLGADQMPVISPNLGYIGARIKDVHEVGDHFLAIGEVDHLMPGDDAEPLLYYRGEYARLA